MKDIFQVLMVDGCFSAQTSDISIEDARKDNTPLQKAREFAEKFGNKAAYVGWGWSMNPGVAQGWTGEFVENLKGGKTENGAGERCHSAGERCHSA